MKKILTGIVIGSTLSLSAVTLAEPIKEYILTKVNYPIIVDGTEYISEDLPILNYQGNTYVPLRAMSDLLEADMKWHKEAKIIEINKKQLPVPTPEKEKNISSDKEESISSEKDEIISLKIGETYTEGKFSITLDRAYRSGGVLTCHFSFENDEDRSIETYTYAEVLYGHDNPNLDKSTSGPLWFFPSEAKAYSYPSKEKGYLSFKATSELNKIDLKPASISLKGNDGQNIVWNLQGI